MRYYRIDITNPKTGKLVQPAYWAAAGLPSSYTSFVNGQTLPNALNVVLDIPVSTYANPRQGARLQIWGVSLAELSEANNLAFCDILIYAGMQKGLPLANPAQAGLIMQGTIFQAFGNWEGPLQTLNMTLLPPMGAIGTPVNIVFNCPPNTAFGPVIESALRTAFPLYTVKVVISADLKTAGPQWGNYPTLNAFAQAIYRLSQSQQFQGIKPLGGGVYPGVNIVIKGRTILVFDGTGDYGAATFDNPKQIDFQDMVGQPTWISPTSINFKCIMRADIGVGDYIRMPDKIASPFVLTTTQAAFPNAPSRDTSIFKGKFAVQEVHHFGNFRQGDGSSWVTTYDAVAVPEKAAT